MDDMQLLLEYARTGSQAAFSALVSRHIDWVYGVCRRRVVDASLADDVTQAVFIVLARKAAQLSEHTILVGWLMNAIHYAAADALKSQSRRRRHERKAAEMYQTATPTPAEQAEIQEMLPCVDEAVARLPAGYRDAIALRFYRRQSYAEMSLALGLSEDATKKRVSRGLEKLRSLLRGRSGTFSVAVLTAAAASVAPSSLHAAVVTAATTGQAGAALAIANGTLNLMAWAKAKVAIVLVAAALGGAGATAVIVQQNVFESNAVQSNIASLDSSPVATIAVVAEVPEPAPRDPSFVVDDGAEFSQQLDSRLLRFVESGGAFDHFHLTIPIQALPNRAIQPVNVIVERNGEAATMLVRSAREALPYAYVADGFLVRIDPENPGGVIVAEGISPDIVARANAVTVGAMTEISVAAAAHKRIDVNVASLIEELQRGATGRSHDERHHLLRFSKPNAGGRIVLAPDAAPGTPPVSAFNVTERVRLAMGVNDIRVDGQGPTLPRLSAEMINDLGLSVRQVTPTAASGDLLPPAGFFDNRAHQAAAIRLNSLFQPRDRRISALDFKRLDSQQQVALDATLGNP